MLRIKSASFDFSSTQVDLSSDIAEKVISWGEEVIDEGDIYTEDGDRSYGREQNIHCTVKYGLHTTNSDEVRKKIAGFGEFSIQLGEVSRFVPEDKPYDVVKIAVEGDRLFDLNKLISELPNSDEHPLYKPHITIAYIKSGTNYELSGKRPLAGIEIPVIEIVFSSKTGERVVIEL